MESISKKFPGIETAFLAEEMARVLRQMVREDREYAKKEKLQKPFAQRPRKEQVAELIFQLRDQRGDDSPRRMRRKTFSWVGAAPAKSGFAAL